MSAIKLVESGSSIGINPDVDTIQTGATSTEVEQYLTNVRNAFSDYGSNVSNASRLGRTDVHSYQLKFRVLKYLVRIVIEYFSVVDYENDNLFTTDEIRDVMQHINNICNTDYMIEF